MFLIIRLPHWLVFFLTGMLWALAPSDLVWVQGMNLGVPPIWNFPKTVYHGGTQNWGMAQDSRGVLYVANNEGLLEYTGARWSCYPVANKTVVRSVTVARDGRIFVGAQSEMGYFAPSENGSLRYHSLVPLLPVNERSFEDVWHVVIHGESVFFQTESTVFEYAPDGVMRLHKPGGLLSALFETPRGLLLQHQYQYLCVFQEGAFRMAFSNPDLNSALTGCMHASGDTLLFASLKNGLFELTPQHLVRSPTPHDALLYKHRIYSAAGLSKGMMALGTSTGGLFILDRQKRVFRHLLQSHGLQNNNILYTFSDRYNNLWLGLDNGIDYMAPFSPFTHLLPDGTLHGTGYAAALSDGWLYLGVSNGAYRIPWKTHYDPPQQSGFESVAGSEGQVWSLKPCNGQLLMGHHEGAFELHDLQSRLLYAQTGVWNFLPLSPQYLLSGTYNGLILYGKSSNGWQPERRVEGIAESCRFLVKDDDGRVWVSHPYRGIFSVVWPGDFLRPPEVRFFNKTHGLPSDLNNFVFSISGKAVFATERGIFRFDARQSAFFPDTLFNHLLGNVGAVRYLREDISGNIWYVSEKEIGMLEVEDFGIRKKIHKRLFPDLNEKMVSGFEFIFPADSNNIFFGAEQGFLHYYRPLQYQTDTSVSVLIERVMAGNGQRDSLVFGGWWISEHGTHADQPGSVRPLLPPTLNQLTFYFASPQFAHRSQTEYRFRLKGFDNAWSSWSAESVRHFTNLPPGTYCFEVQARSKNTYYSAVSSFFFKIRAPWYATSLAVIAYLFACVGVLGALWYRQKRRFEHEKHSMVVQHQQITDEQRRAVEASQAAVSDILRSKLENEIRFKNQELATATMHLVQKGEILQTVQQNLHQILQQSTNQAVKKEIQQLLNLLNFDTALDEDWDQFAHHFDQVHVDFLKRVRERYPHLSNTDYKLSAYLRMNLSTKEIAPLMNISVRGVEASRYRLRKKLGLSNDANLTDCILNI